MTTKTATHMCTLALTLLLALALVVCSPARAAANTTAAATTNSSRCDEDLLFQKLYVLMPAMNQCAKETDYYINTEKLALPTNASLTKFCKSENCTRLSNELDAAGLPSCTVQVGAGEVPLKEFFAQIKTECAKSAVKPVGTTSAAAPQTGLQVSLTVLLSALAAFVCAVFE